MDSFSTASSFCLRASINFNCCCPRLKRGWKNRISKTIWTWSVSFCILCSYESSNSNIFSIFQWYHFFFNLIWQSSLSLNGHMNEQHGKKSYKVLVPPRNCILLTWVPSKRHLVYGRFLISVWEIIFLRKFVKILEIRGTSRNKIIMSVTRCCLPNLSARLNFFSS